MGLRLDNRSGKREKECSFRERGFENSKALLETNFISRVTFAQRKRKRERERDGKQNPVEYLVVTWLVLGNIN